MNRLIEEALHQKLDSIEVSPFLEAQTIKRISASASKRPAPKLHASFASLMVAAAVCAVCLIAYKSILNPHPPLPPPAADAISHNITLAEIVVREPEGKVPFGTYFKDRLILLAKNESGASLNNGVRWDSSPEIIRSDIESALGVVIQKPLLPAGDFTTEHHALVEEATGDVAAYRTDYYYFVIETMEFRSRFSIFYLAMRYFDEGELKKLQNVRKVDGKVIIDAFPPVQPAHFKVGQLRMMLYIDTDAGIAVESIAYPVWSGEKEDETASLHLYAQVDSAHIAMMHSIV
jgi:hypothetical protein